MMDDIIRSFGRLRWLWERDKLSKLDWDDLEWELKQSSLEFAGLLTHLRHLHEELDFRSDEEQVEDLRRRLSLFQQMYEQEQKRVRLAVDEARATAERFRRGEEDIRKELEAVRAELARAREEAELLSRDRSDVPLFAEEGNDSDGQDTDGQGSHDGLHGDSPGA